MGKHVSTAIALTSISLETLGFSFIRSVGFGMTLDIKGLCTEYRLSKSLEVLVLAYLSLPIIQVHFTWLIYFVRGTNRTVIIRHPAWAPYLLRMHGMPTEIISASKERTHLGGGS